MLCFSIFFHFLHFEFVFLHFEIVLLVIRQPAAVLPGKRNEPEPCATCNVIATRYAMAR